MTLAEEIDDVVTRMTLAVVRHTIARRETDDAMHEERRLRATLMGLLKKIPATPEPCADSERGTAR